MKYDIFISHASEDKENFVRPLALKLINCGCKVWYDEFTLKIGDSLTNQINKGLKDSKFGLIIISKNFFKKKWTNYELCSLNIKQINSKKVILPILHQYTYKELLKNNLALADSLYCDTKDKSIDDIVLKIIEVTNPNFFTNYLKTRLAEQLHNETKIDFSHIVNIVNPLQSAKQKLSSNQLARIRIIRAVCYVELRKISLSDFAFGISLNEDPEIEICWWENFIIFWQEFCLYQTNLDFRKSNRGIVEIIQ